MRTNFLMSPAGTSPVFDISSLTWLRQQLTGHERAAPWPQYTVVLVERACPAPELSTAGSQAPQELYFGRTDSAALALVPARARGQVLRFTDEFVALAGHDRQLLLFELFHQATTAAVPVPAELAVELALLLAGMKRQATGAVLLREDLLRSYLKTLLLYCTRLSQQHRQQAGNLVQPGLFGRFQLLLEERYTLWKSVSEYAEHLHVTANHLSVSIRKETGRPASDHIRHRVVLEAQRLVSLHDVPLKEVAYQLGFEDVSHFSKLFKRCTGITFSDFKEQAQAQYRRPERAVA